MPRTEYSMCQKTIELFDYWVIELDQWFSKCGGAQILQAGRGRSAGKKKKKNVKNSHCYSVQVREICLYKAASNGNYMGLVKKAKIPVSAENAWSFFFLQAQRKLKSPVPCRQKMVNAVNPNPSTSNVAEKTVKKNSVMEKCKFQTQWLLDFDWLLYDEEKDVMTQTTCGLSW